MRSLSLIGFAVVVALGASPAWAQTDTKTQVISPAGDVKKVAVKNPDEVICVHQASIDTRIPGPAECHTRRVWDEMSDQARRDTQNLQQRSMAQSQKGG
jgi:hypothetical protein